MHSGYVIHFVCKEIFKPLVQGKWEKKKAREKTIAVILREK